MQKIYINTVDRTFYDETGTQFQSGFPRLAYKRTERIEIQLCSATPSAGTPGLDPETDWTKDTQFGVSGIGAKLSVDDDFLRRRKGALTAAISAGSIASISAEIPLASKATVRGNGILRVYNANGEAEGFEYESISISGTTVTFTLASGSSASESYAVGAEMDVPDAIYMQAIMDADASDAANGFFAFDIVAYSEKLRAVMEYENISELSSLAGMELLLYQVSGGQTVELENYLCTTVSLHGTIAEANPNAVFPDTLNDELTGLIVSALGDVETEYSADGSNWHSTMAQTDKYLRFKLTGSGVSGDWIEYEMKQGPQGTAAGFGTPTATATTLDPDDSATASITASGPDTAKVFAFQFGIPKGESSYTYVAYASDDEGTGWSMTPSDALPYRAEIHTSEEIETPTAADFDDAIWVKYLGDDFENTSYMTFNSVSSSNTITLISDCVPVAVRSGITGNFYPIEKGSVALGAGAFTLNITAYLAYDNAGAFSGTWKVFLAAGLPGEQQDGNEIITLTGTAITPAPNVVFKKTLAADDAFTIDTSGLTSTRQMTFELHLTQPSTAVTFTLPASLVWPAGDEFTSTASPPAMSAGGKTYAIVIRWDGENLLANLAYTKGAIA